MVTHPTEASSILGVPCAHFVSQVSSCHPGPKVQCGPHTGESGFFHVMLPSWVLGGYSMPLAVPTYPRCGQTLPTESTLDGPNLAPWIPLTSAHQYFRCPLGSPGSTGQERIPSLLQGLQGSASAQSLKKRPPNLGCQHAATHLAWRFTERSSSWRESRLPAGFQQAGKEVG